VRELHHALHAAAVHALGPQVRQHDVVLGACARALFYTVLSLHAPAAGFARPKMQPLSCSPVGSADDTCCACAHVCSCSTGAAPLSTPSKLRVPPYLAIAVAGSSLCSAHGKAKFQHMYAAVS